MSARFKTKQYTFVSSSPVNAYVMLGSPMDEFISTMTVRAGKDNLDIVYWQEPGGTKGGYLEPREAASFDLTGKYVSGKHVEFVGLAGDSLYLTVVG